MFDSNARMKTQVFVYLGANYEINAIRVKSFANLYFQSDR